MLPRLLFSSLLLLFVSSLYCQDYVKDYSTKLSDTAWRVSYYGGLLGPLERIETYKDRQKAEAHGRFAWYDMYGMVDSTGMFIDGKREGTWVYYNDKQRWVKKRIYAAGVLVNEEYPDTTASKKGEEPKVGEVDAEFEGGITGWQKYMTRNLRYPIEAIRGGMQGMVRIGFMIDKRGEVSEPWVFRSVCRALDEESLRLIIKSPRWEPATKDGERVNSYKIQPITYRTPR